MIGIKTKKRRLAFTRALFVLLTSAAIIVLMYPFLPELIYVAEKEAEAILHPKAPEEYEYPDTLITPSYRLVGTQEEKEAVDAGRIENSVAGLDILDSANLKQKPIVNPEYKQLVIKKIGVDMPIVVTGKEYNEKDAYDALNKGAWLYTTTSTPDKGSNTVLAGHRYKYLPPASNTFYFLDKISRGDEISIYWQGREYQYRVSDTQIVPPEDLSVLEPSTTPTLTLITCTPLFTIKNRLIITAKLIGVQ